MKKTSVNIRQLVQGITVIDRNGRLSLGKFPSVADERNVTRGEVLAICRTLDGATLATRNVSAFDGLRLALVNPWAAA